MRYVVWVRCEFRTDMGWDYIWNEYTGIVHETKKAAESEMRKAESEGYYAIIKEVEYDEV